jgi:hypothetical protein
MQKIILLNPFYISGFSDAEACFRPSLDHKYQPRFSFHIGLNLKDQDIIQHFNYFFNNKGRINIYKPHNEIRITFENLDVINHYIIPHFDSYPLLGIKHLDYLLFKEGIYLINTSNYKTTDGLRKFSKLALLMNEGYKKNIIDLFPDLINYSSNLDHKISNLQFLLGLSFNPVLNPSINPWWLTGFIDGDASFSASIKYKNIEKTKIAFQPSLSISQHKNNLILFESIKKYFTSGNVYNKKSSNGEYSHIQYQISSAKDIKKNIISHFESYPLMAYKKNVYQVWAELILLLNNESSESRNIKAIGLIDKIKLLNS